MSTKDKILEISADVFAKYGYKAVSISSLLKEIGINKSTLYYYFKSKKEIFEEVVKRNFDNLIKKLEENIAKCKTPEEKIDVFIDTIAQRSRRDVLLIVREIIDGGENFSDELINLFIRFRETLLNILKEGKEKNVFKNDDVFFTMHLIIGINDFHKMVKPFVENKLSNIYQKPDEKKFRQNLKKIVLNYLKDEL